MKFNIYDLLSPLFFTLLFANDFKISSVSILLVSTLVISITTLFVYRKNVQAIMPELISGILALSLICPMIIMEVSAQSYYVQALLALPLSILCMPLIFKFSEKAHSSSRVIFIYFVFTIPVIFFGVADLNPFGYNVTYKIIIFFAFCTILSRSLHKLIFNLILWGAILLNLSRGGFVTAAVSQLALKKISLWLLVIFFTTVLFIVPQNDTFLRAIYFSLDNASEMARIAFMKSVFELMSSASLFNFFFGLSSVNKLGTYPHNIFLELFLYGGVFQVFWFVPVFLIVLFTFLILWFRGHGVRNNFLFRFWLISFIPSLLSGDLFYNLFFISSSLIIFFRTLFKNNAFYNYNW